MSDAIKHECGLAFIRLRKPFSYYQQQYGSVTWGLNKLYLLMEKQHNRGQDGAGIAAVKLNVEPGYPFMHRLRSCAQQPIADVFRQVGEEIQELEKFNPDITRHPGLLKGHLRFLGELMLGHLRYGTQGKNNAEFCHPFNKLTHFTHVYSIAVGVTYLGATAYHDDAFGLEPAKHAYDAFFKSGASYNAIIYHHQRICRFYSSVSDIVHVLYHFGSGSILCDECAHLHILNGDLFNANPALQ